MNRNTILAVMAASVVITTIDLYARGQAPTPTNYFGSLILFLILLLISMASEGVAAGLALLVLFGQLLIQGPTVANALARASRAKVGAFHPFPASGQQR